MPRKTKDITENVDNKTIDKTTSKKSSFSETKKTSKTTSKKSSSTSKKTSSKKDDNLKASSKKSTANKNTKRNSAKKNTTSTKKIEILEYYDLPYRYNETIVKILAQTPNTLFVYWDISDDDKNNYIKEYGEYFFNNTKPVLVIHNITKNYNFEVDINDFANSWYLRVDDSDCEYKIELGRRPINNYVSISNNYLFISNSNNIKAPNDHILFEKIPNNILFKNVKTNDITEKATVNYLVKFKKSYNTKEFYKEMYKDENINFDKLMINNPSSSFK